MSNRLGSQDSMAPNTASPATELSTTETKEPAPFKPRMVWPNFMVFILLHLSCVYGGLYIAFFKASWWTWLFALIIGLMAGLGVTAGAHRLWSHKAYKARLPLRIMLGFFNLLACQNDIYEWCRDHRVHHKYSETDADPHNVNRGFWFAHVGWLMTKKHPDVFTKGKNVDCSDLLEDSVVRFQRKYYVPLVALVCFILPAIIPTLWGDTLWNGFFVATMVRYVLSLNVTWLVNSAAHMWGNQPYDPKISARENMYVAFGAIGEGFHNYHHTFPWDYSTSELGWKLNPTTMFIDLMAKIGWAYDLKKATPEMVVKRRLRTSNKGLSEQDAESDTKQS